MRGEGKINIHAELGITSLCPHPSPFDPHPSHLKKTITSNLDY
jgi:hypothetical protein